MISLELIIDSAIALSRGISSSNWFYLDRGDTFLRFSHYYYLLMNLGQHIFVL